MWSEEMWICHLAQESLLQLRLRGGRLSRNPLQNQNRSIFFLSPLDYFSAAGGFTFQSGGGGETHGRPLSPSKRTYKNAPAQHFKCGWRQKAGLLLRHLILWQTQQKEKRLIYLKCNTSALAAVPACWGKCELPRRHFKYWKIMMIFLSFLVNRLTSRRGCTFPLLIPTQTCCFILRASTENREDTHHTWNKSRADRSQIYVTFCLFNIFWLICQPGKQCAVQGGAAHCATVFYYSSRL